MMSDPMLDDPLLQPAIAAVRSAIVVCRAVQRRQDEVRAIVKADNSPVTVADFASQAVVARSLRAALGDVRLVAEEDASLLHDGTDRACIDAVLRAVRLVWPDATTTSLIDAVGAGGAAPHAEGFWTLDPIDGTKGFLRGQQYAISLAYVRDGRPVVGVLGCPNLSASPHEAAHQVDPEGLLCFARHGSGAGQLPGGARAGAPVAIACGGGTDTDPLTVCTSVDSSHRDASSEEAVLRCLGGRARMLRLDSQCKYALVARGDADGYLRIPPSPAYREWIWDHAAGALIAAESGCTVTDLAGRPLDFGRGRRLVANHGVICAGRVAHARLLEAVRQAGVADRGSLEPGPAPPGGHRVAR